MKLSDSLNFILKWSDSLNFILKLSEPNCIFFNFQLRGTRGWLEAGSISYPCRLAVAPLALTYPRIPLPNGARPSPLSAMRRIASS